MTHKLLITRQWPDSIEQDIADIFDVTLRRPDIGLTPDEWYEAFCHYDIILLTVSDILPDDIWDIAHKKVKLLANFGVGFNHINIEKAKMCGIMVTNTPDILTDCTADLTMALLLMVARRMHEGEQEIRRNVWQGWHPIHNLGTSVKNKTLAIIGMGRIGQAVAKRAYFGFDMNIICYSNSCIQDDILAQYNAVQYDNLRDILPLADMVSLHCPLTEQTHHLMDSVMLSLMKPSSFIINTARGPIIDEHALIQALHRGIIAGAGLDVYEHEPTLHDELRQLSNVVLMPHIGSATIETRIKMGQRVLANIIAYRDGDIMPDKIV